MKVDVIEQKNLNVGSLNVRNLNVMTRRNRNVMEDLMDCPKVPEQS